MKNIKKLSQSKCIWATVFCGDKTQWFIWQNIQFNGNRTFQLRIDKRENEYRNAFSCPAKERSKKELCVTQQTATSREKSSYRGQVTGYKFSHCVVCPSPFRHRWKRNGQKKIKIKGGLVNRVDDLLASSYITFVSSCITSSCITGQPCKWCSQ